MVIKQKQPRPQMEVHVQRQLSKNVVQHPLQGHTPGGGGGPPGGGGGGGVAQAAWRLKAFLCSLVFPNRPQTDMFPQRPTGKPGSPPTSYSEGPDV